MTIDKFIESLQAYIRYQYCYGPAKPYVLLTFKIDKQWSKTDESEETTVLLDKVMEYLDVHPEADLVNVKIV